ncbi:MAG: type II toxin-antitoxin system prevent-host-death family antitoxin [Calditrichaeota bacterium]|nr:MAG: type II toxin-antitoxin system prevent-host-death family antitoxin [Calditrichota bacterium]
MKTTLGVLEARTHWSELLEMVHQGTEVIITKRGKPIAKLIPVRKDGARMKAEMETILKEFDQIRQRVQGKIDIKALIAEGRA